MNTSKISIIFNKQTIVNILVITIISASLGFVYNILQPNPLPLIYKPKHVDLINETELFGDDSTQVIPQIIENNKQTSSDIVKDTIRKIEEGITKNEITKNELNEKQEQITISNSKELKSVNYDQIKRIVGNKDFVVIDARREEDYKKAHIPGAINLFALAEPNEKFEIIMSLPVGKKYVIYCDGGNCDLSHQLANEFLTSFGFTNVYIYEGGWEEWIKNNQ